MKTLALFFLVSLLAAGDASAYIDPGGIGQAYFQYLLAGFLALVFSAGPALRRVKEFFSKPRGGANKKK